jgi:hypothetical protein
VKTVSIEAVDKVLAALVGIISDQDARIKELEARHVDHSCDVLDRQVARLLKACEGDSVTCVMSDWIIDNFITDPADGRP